MRNSYSEEFMMSEERILQFAEFSGDFSPIHIDEAYAANTKFKKRIAHGAILEAYISKILGMNLPGPGTIYMSQSCKWMKPVYIGDTVEICVKIVKIWDGRKCLLETNCYVKDNIVMEGEAIVLLPEDYGND